MKRARATVPIMEAGKRIRVATYTRISTDEEHQPYSLEAQTERLGAYVKSQDGWELTRHFTDQMTGSRLERPGLQKALSVARAEGFDLLLVYRVDRLSRSVRGLAQILEELDKAGVLFRSATEPFDTGTPAGRMMVQMLGVFAEFERATLIDRVVAGMERKAARGGWHGGVVPFGYRLNAGHLEVKAEEAPLVRLIFELYCQQRLGARAVATSLNERGHRTAAGRLWSHRSVLSVLQNRSYLGEIFFRGVHHPATHSALVDSKLFERAKKLLEERGEDLAKRRSNPFDYLLTGLMRCTRCGKSYVGAAAHGKRNRYRYYVCHSRQRYGSDACSADRLPADRLEAAMNEALVQTLGRSDLVEQAVKEAHDRAEAARPRHQGELAALEAEIAKTRQTLDRYFAAFESGSMSEAACAARVESLTQKLGQLKTRHAELTEVVQSESEPTVTPKQVEDVLSHVKDVLAGGHPQQVKALLQVLVAEVRVDSRDSIKPVFRVPMGGVRILDGVVDPRGFEPLTS
jgi:site-specific DNA recombinase